MRCRELEGVGELSLLEGVLLGGKVCERLVNFGMRVRFGFHSGGGSKRGLWSSRV